MFQVPGGFDVDWQMLAAIAESLGALGVILSVLYLAVQVRSGTRATRRSNAHAFKSDWRAFYTLIGENSEAASILQRGLMDPESLSIQEYYRFSTFLIQITTLWEEAFYAGLDEDVERWATYSDSIARPETVGLPGYQRWYALRGHWFTPEFREVVEAEMKLEAGNLPSFYSNQVTDGGDS
jgi:hypothetical protein